MDYPFDFMLRRLASGNNIFHTSKVRFPLIKLASNVVAFFAGIKLLLCRNNLRKVKFCKISIAIALANLSAN